MKRFRLVTDFNALALGVWVYIEPHEEVVLSFHLLNFALEIVIFEGPV
jgi:hypothetical protein